MSGEPSRTAEAREDLSRTQTHVATEVFAATPTSSLPSLKLAASGASLPHLTGEIRDLVQIRLREVALLVTVGWSMVLLVCFSGVDELFSATRLGAGCVGVIVLCTLTFIGCWIVLHVGLHYSLFWLRAFEAVYLWGSVICAAWLRYSAVSYALERSTPDRFMVLYASALTNLTWMSVFVIYGIFAPNTWRRLVMMMVSVVAVLIVVDVVTWTNHPVMDSNLVAANVMVTLMAIFLGVGTALYGSFKLGAAHEEAVTARRQLRDLGRYRLTHRIGAGAMGEVYLAEHTLLRRPCAVKLIRPTGVDGEKQVARFAREVQATAALTHPNTVEIYDYGRSEDGTFYYAMEYLPGHTLDQLVERSGRLPAARVIHLLRQVCGALREAHGAGLVHRDIKPANIIVCTRGGVYDVVKLLDFGLVREIEPETDSGKLTQIGTLAGTPEYMSPEQSQGLPEIDGRSDIYSLGAVAYYLLTGRPPFKKETSLQLLFAHVHEPVPPINALRPDIAADLATVVHRCLEKDLARRYQTVASLEADLSACATGDVWTQASAAAWWQRNTPEPVGETVQPYETAAG